MIRNNTRCQTQDATTHDTRHKTQDTTDNNTRHNNTRCTTQHTTCNTQHRTTQYKTQNTTHTTQDTPTQDTSTQNLTSHDTTTQDMASKPNQVSDLHTDARRKTQHSTSHETIQDTIHNNQYTIHTNTRHRTHHYTTQHRRIKQHKTWRASSTDRPPTHNQLTQQTRHKPQDTTPHSTRRNNTSHIKPLSRHRRAQDIGCLVALLLHRQSFLLFDALEDGMFFDGLGPSRMDCMFEVVNVCMCANDLCVFAHRSAIMISLPHIRKPYIVILFVMFVQHAHHSSNHGKP